MDFHKSNPDHYKWLVQIVADRIFDELLKNSNSDSLEVPFSGTFPDRWKITSQNLKEENQPAIYFYLYYINKVSTLSSSLYLNPDFLKISDPLDKFTKLLFPNADNMLLAEIITLLYGHKGQTAEENLIKFATEVRSFGHVLNSLNTVFSGDNIEQQFSNNMEKMRNEVFDIIIAGKNREVDIFGNGYFSLEDLLKSVQKLTEGKLKKNTKFPIKTTDLRKPITKTSERDKNLLAMRENLEILMQKINLGTGL